MSKKVIHAVIITLVLQGILSLQSGIPAVRGEPHTRVVPDQYEKIQWAIENATAGDTILVRGGTYYEHLSVNKRLTLLGESRENTVVDGSGKNLTIIEVTASGVVISGFTVRNSSRAPGTSYAGIKVLGGHECNITGNHVTRNKIGIFVTSEMSRIAENIATENGHGITLYDSSTVTVEANNVSANTVGISLAFSSDNKIIRNRAANSSTGGHGITLSSNSFNNTVVNNDLMDNYHGIWLSSSFNNSIVKNTIANNELLGIELASSPDNIFYHNNLVNNPKHIVIDYKSTNIWDCGYPSGGNYWSDYGTRYPTAEEIDDSGIWNTPYIINNGNIDGYPLMEPHGDISSIIRDGEKLTANAGSDQTVTIGTSVSFDASGSTGNIMSYIWDFGDGTTGTGITCNHAYTETGTYNVALTVKNAMGSFDTDTLIVTATADENSAPVDSSALWVGPLAVVMGMLAVAALFWKLKGSKKKRKRR